MDSPKRWARPSSAPLPRPHTRSKVTRTARVWRAQKPTTIHTPRMKHAGRGTGSVLLLQLKPLLEFQRRFKEQNGRRAEDVEHPEHLAHLLQLYRRHRAELLPGGNLTGKENISRLIGQHDGHGGPAPTSMQPHACATGQGLHATVVTLHCPLNHAYVCWLSPLTGKQGASAAAQPSKPRASPFKLSSLRRNPHSPARGASQRAASAAGVSGATWVSPKPGRGMTRRSPLKASPTQGARAARALPTSPTLTRARQGQGTDAGESAAAAAWGDAWVTVQLSPKSPSMCKLGFGAAAGGGGGFGGAARKLQLGGPPEALPVHPTPSKGARFGNWGTGTGR